MAVLRQDLQRTTFQDKQIKLMTEMTVDLEGLRKDNDKNFTDLRTSLLSGFSSSIQGLYYSFVRYIETGTAAFVSDIEDIIQDVREGIDEDSDDREQKSLKEHQRQADKYRSYMDSQTKDIGAKIGKVIGGLSQIASIFGISWDRYTELADQYSDLQNIYVRNTSTTREDAKALRDSILQTVGELNKKTDNLYSGISSFELIVGMINTTGIKNREFYEEYAEIFLESQKTMNLNLGTLAEFSDKFYRKYNFSSQTMEHLTDSIRQNTAGTSVSEDKMMQFMQELDSDIMSYAMRMGGDVESNYSRIQDNITSVYSWLNTQGYDSDYLFKLITGAASGDISNKTTLESFGVSSDGGYLMRQLMTDPSGLMTQLINAIGSRRIGTGFGDYGRQIASAYGIDYDTAVLAERKGLSRESYRDFLDNRQYSSDPANEIWMSVEERTANATESIAATMSDTQESVGIKLSTLTTTLQSIYRIIAAVYGASIGQTLWKFLSGTFTKGLGLQGLLGSGSSLLGALGKAGAIAAAAYLIYDTVDSEIKRKRALEGIGEEIGTASSSNAANNLHTIVDEEGTVGSAERSSEVISTNTAHNIESKMLGATSQNQSLVDKATGWTLKTFGGWTDEDVLRAQTENTLPGAITGNKYKVALYSSALDAKNGTGVFRGKEPDDTMYRMLQAYENKGELYEDWMWAWLGGAPNEGYDTNNLRYALENFREGKLIRPKRTYILGIHSGYDKKSYETVPAYKLGTPYVPSDQLSYLHEGEAVIPAMENPFSKYATSRYNRSEELRQIVEHTRTIAAEQPDDHGSEFNKIIDTMKDILSFLQYWRTDNISRDSVNDVLQSARNTNLKLQILTGESTLATDSVG